MDPRNDEATARLDVIVIGGGQTGLALGFFLRRTGLSYVILDREPIPGGAWPHAWNSLRLFSPAAWSSLPGWQIPATAQGNPSREEVIDYLGQYEQRYGLPVIRPVTVSQVQRAGDGYRVVADDGRQWQARAVLSATGTWSSPFIPDIPGRDLFHGRQLHSAHYAGPQPFAGQRVAIIGGGNSGAQILAEVSTVAQTRWLTLQPPAFLPDEVDGRVLFERATERWRAQQEGRPPTVPAGGFGDIVMVPPVQEARRRGVLTAAPMPERFTADGAVWADGHHEPFDALIWCTGFRPALGHLAPLGVLDAQGRVELDASQLRALREPGLWLLGYGDWNGMASATLVGITRYARQAVQQVQAWLQPRMAAVDGIDPASTAAGSSPALPTSPGMAGAGNDEP
ncbi:MAG: ArsO family NAD(P)H-dependent flavin-containing monooxygenase [Stenotrophomonas koreensis]